MSQSLSILAKGISYRYSGNDFFSLKPLDLSILNGKCTGLIGPNGAGKSTLLSVLSGLLAPNTGSVSYPKYSQLTLPQAVKQHVALVPQDFAFYPQLSVKDNLHFFAELSKASAESIDEVAEQCQINSVKNRQAGKLSGGNKRKLNLAIALLQNPDVLFLDEPTVGIDPISRKIILDLIARLKAQGMTIVYTSHLLSEVEGICDLVYAMQEGQISRFETHQKYYLNVKLLSNEKNNLIERMNGWARVVNSEASEYENSVIFTLTEKSNLANVLTALGDFASIIESMSYEPISLERYYQETFGQDDS